MRNRWGRLHSTWWQEGYRYEHVPGIDVSKCSAAKKTVKEQALHIVFDICILEVDSDHSVAETGFFRSVFESQWFWHKMDRRVVGKSKTELLGPRGRYTGDEQPDSPVILML